MPTAISKNKALARLSASSWIKQLITARGVAQSNVELGLTCQAYLNLKAYGEFAGHDRPTGFNTWLTLSFSPLGPTNPKSAMVTK